LPWKKLKLFLIIIFFREKVFRAMKILDNATPKDMLFARREFGALFKANYMRENGEERFVQEWL